MDRFQYPVAQRDLASEGGIQMKSIFKKLSVLALATFMMGTTVIPAFAAETTPTDEGVTVAEYTLTADDSGNISARTNNIVGSVIGSGQTVYYYPNLDSYIGFSKTFVAATSSAGSTTGAVFLYLYNSNGKLVSNDWIMGINDNASWSVTLPSSGTYTLKVVLSGTNGAVSFSAKWA